ncbi:hypothetical protein ACJRPK_09515 [Aquimarina sp. 2-A2]|uniref:hypothetical protein n=1 Tax=Aquimarina sp. 2-A2 TaxID=3382644 RepID=UPI00387F167E
MKKGLSETHASLRLMAVIMTLSLVFIQPVLQVMFFLDDTSPTVLILGSEENNEEDHNLQTAVDHYKLDQPLLVSFLWDEIKSPTNFGYYTTRGFSEIILDIPIPPPDVVIS